jgi:hypothetical protein
MFLSAVLTRTALYLLRIFDGLPAVRQNHAALSRVLPPKRSLSLEDAIEIAARISVNMHGIRYKNVAFDLTNTSLSVPACALSLSLSL